MVVLDLADLNVGPTPSSTPNRHGATVSIYTQVGSLENFVADTVTYWLMMDFVSVLILHIKSSKYSTVYAWRTQLLTFHRHR